MGVVSVLSNNPGLRDSIRGSLEARHSVASKASWERLLHLIRERPITSVVLDQGTFRSARGPEGALATLRARFPSVAAVLIAHPDTDPNALLRLGRIGADGLVLVRLDDIVSDVPAAVSRGLSGGAAGLVTRSVAPYVGGRELRVVRLALEGALRGWGADDVARRLNLTRAHLSVLTRAVGLPSVGHLLGWCRLFHAGRWFQDPGRSAESISRQLEYSSGAAFRRALRNYTAATPTQVRSQGGLTFVLERFMECHPPSGVRFGPSVA
jgi:AraC-like DNA-binding protein